MGNCVVPKSLCWGIPLNSSLLHCSPHLPPSAFRDRNRLTWKGPARPSGSHSQYTDSETESRERKSLTQGTQLHEGDSQTTQQMSDKPARTLSCLPEASSTHPQSGRCHTKAVLSSNRVGKCLRGRGQAHTSHGFLFWQEPRLVDSILYTSGKGCLPACLWGIIWLKFIMTVVNRTARKESK